MTSIFRSQAGVGLTEVMVAGALLSVAVLAFVSAQNIAGNAMRGTSEVLSVTAIQSEIAQQMENSYALGAGYLNAGSAALANTFDPSNTGTQNIKIFDANTGTVEAYVPYFDVADPTYAAAPLTAMIDDEKRRVDPRTGSSFVLRSLYLRQKSNGEIGSMQSFTRDGVTYNRRAFYVDMHMDLISLAGINKNSSANYIHRTIPLNILIERPASGGSWKIAKTNSADGMAFNIGWQEDASDCVNVDGPANSNGVLVQCPTGYFITSNALDYAYQEQPYYCSCGKNCSYVCGVYIVAQRAVPHLKCCRVRN